MPSSRRPIAIGNYDFRASGTVAKSIEIATAAVEAGLPAQLWVVRAKGPFLERVPGNVPVVEIGWNGWLAQSRSLDLALSIPALSCALRRHKPGVFVSGGNHLHLPAKLAVYLAGCRTMLRYGLRASNSSLRPSGDGAPVKSNTPFWDRFKYTGADFVVAVSNDLADEIKRSNPSLHIYCVPNGVDIKRIRKLAMESFHHPYITDRSAERPLLVAMGRICRQKGFDVLIRALSSLPPRIRARLLVVGDGSQSEISKLRALAEARGVADCVDFLGYRANPFAVLSKADLFVSASRWEGASNALNEALVCGVPVVATDCPTGNREALKGGRYGTLVPVEDPQALADGIVAELSAGHRIDVLTNASEELDLYTCLDNWVKLLALYHNGPMARQ